MKIFKISDRIEVVCNSERTRNGFRHLATLLIDGREDSKAKCTYQNRTWERYEFQSVLFKAIENSGLCNNDKSMCKDFIEKYKDSDNTFTSTIGIAKLGEVFCNTQKEKNDWKLRMLKAGLENRGLDVPEDWDSLSEDEKESRLNKVLQFETKEPTGKFENVFGGGIE